MQHIAVTCDICGAPFASVYEVRRYNPQDWNSFEIVQGLDLCAGCWDEVKRAALRKLTTKRPEPRAKIVYLYPEKPNDGDE